MENRRDDDWPDRSPMNAALQLPPTPHRQPQQGSFPAGQPPAGKGGTCNTGGNMGSNTGGNSNSGISAAASSSLPFSLNPNLALQMLGAGVMTNQINLPNGLNLEQLKQLQQCFQAANATTTATATGTGTATGSALSVNNGNSAPSGSREFIPQNNNSSSIIITNNNNGVQANLGVASPFVQQQKQQPLASESHQPHPKGSMIIPCRARRMPLNHNFKTAYFSVPSNAKHGEDLVCSFPACRDGGVKFRYCVYCSTPVAKRNFRKRHNHEQKNADGVPTQVTLNNDNNQKPSVATSSGNPNLDSSSLDGNRALPTDLDDLSETSNAKLKPVTQEDADELRKARWASLIVQRPPAEDVKAMEAWINDIMQVSDPQTWATISKGRPTVTDESGVGNPSASSNEDTTSNPNGSSNDSSCAIAGLSNDDSASSNQFADTDGSSSSDSSNDDSSSTSSSMKQKAYKKSKPNATP